MAKFDRMSFMLSAEHFLELVDFEAWGLEKPMPGEQLYDPRGFWSEAEAIAINCINRILSQPLTQDLPPGRAHDTYSNSMTAFDYLSNPPQRPKKLAGGINANPHP